MENRLEEHKTKKDCGNWRDRPPSVGRENYGFFKNTGGWIWINKEHISTGLTFLCVRVCEAFACDMWKWARKRKRTRTVQLLTMATTVLHSLGDKCHQMKSILFVCVCKLECMQFCYGGAIPFLMSQFTSTNQLHLLHTTNWFWTHHIDICFWLAYHHKSKWNSSSHSKSTGICYLILR